MLGSCVLALTLAAGSAPAPARPAPTRPGLSWDEADSLARKLEALEHPTGKPIASPQVLVTETELNSYINLSLAPQIPPGVSDLDVRIEQDRLAAKALVDLERVRGQLPPMGAFNPISYLSGQVPVEVRGRFPNSEGFGTLQVEEVRLGGFSVPIAMVAQLVASATRNRDNPQGFDIQSPFRLPYSVKRVRLQPGKALVER
jgi:hypothetical protein